MPTDNPQTTEPYNRMARWSIDDIKRTLELRRHHYRLSKQSMDEELRDINEMASELLRRLEALN